MTARWRVLGAVCGALIVAAAAAADTSSDAADFLRRPRSPTTARHSSPISGSGPSPPTTDSASRGSSASLGDPAYAIRERATVDLIGVGLPAVSLLRQAATDPDIEIVRRSEKCLAAIERVPSAALSAAAARLVAASKPAGAAAVLLAFLPVADDEVVADEVRTALASVAAHEDPPDPALTAALADPLPVRRGAAAEALIRSRRPDALASGRKMMADADPDVRLRGTRVGRARQGPRRCPPHDRHARRPAAGRGLAGRRAADPAGG